MLLRSFLGQNKAMSKIELFYSRERKTYIILIGSFEQKLTNPRLIFCLRLKTFNKMPWNAGIRCHIFSSPHVSLILGMKRRKVSLSCNYHVKKEEMGVAEKASCFPLRILFVPRRQFKKTKNWKSDSVRKRAMGIRRDSVEQNATDINKSPGLFLLRYPWH